MRRRTKPYLIQVHQLPESRLAGSRSHPKLTSRPSSAGIGPVSWLCARFNNRSWMRLPSSGNVSWPKPQVEQSTASTAGEGPERPWPGYVRARERAHDHAVPGVERSVSAPVQPGGASQRVANRQQRRAVTHQARIGLRRSTMNRSAAEWMLTLNDEEPQARAGCLLGRITEAARQLGDNSSAVILKCLGQACADLAANSVNWLSTSGNPLGRALRSASL